MGKGQNEYPYATCMICGEICDIVEEVDIGGGEYERWCWCEKCEIDTFHAAINKETNEKENEKEN